MLFRQFASRILVLVAVVSALSLAVGAGGQAPTHASGCSFYTVVASSSNTTSNWVNTTYTDPSLKLFVTPTWAGVYDNHPIGVWWTGADWAVFNQDSAAMPIGARFQIDATSIWWPGVYTHTATSGTITGDYTILDNADANGNPNAIVSVTPIYNPGGGSGGVYDNHPIGVWYTGSRWAIFNQDHASMPVNAAFNVKVSAGSSSGATLGVYTHTSTSVSVSGDSTLLSAPAVSGNTLVVVTPNYNPGGVGGAYHNHNIGAWYSGLAQKWYIFNQDSASMSVGHSFNVFWVTC